MRLVTVGPERHPGVLREGKVSDLVHLATDIVELLDPASLEHARAVADSLGEDAWVDIADVVIGAPVPVPPSIYAIGLNYRAHALESNQPIPDVPTVFTKFPTSVTGPGAPIRLPESSSRVDYEGELAVVVGEGGRDILEADAWKKLAALTICHDVSARDHQFVTTQWCLSKSFETFCPLGPCLVTIDELDDPDDLSLQTRLNGEIMQDARTSDLIFSVPKIVAYLSSVVELRQGDVITTGTPAGVGAARKPPVFLEDGDVVEIEIGGVGILTNPVTRAAY